MGGIKSKEGVQGLRELHYLDLPSKDELMLMSYVLRNYFKNNNLRSSPEAARVFSFTLGYLSNWTLTILDVVPVISSAVSLNHFLKASEKVIKVIKKFYRWLKENNGFNDPLLLEYMALFERLLFPTPDVGFWENVRSDAMDYLRFQLGSSHARAFKKQLLTDFRRGEGGIASDFDTIANIFVCDSAISNTKREKFIDLCNKNHGEGGRTYEKTRSLIRKAVRLVTRI